MISEELVQFAEIIRGSIPATPQELNLIVWFGDLDQVQKGKVQQLLMDELCPACHDMQPHLMSFVGNWNQFTCQVCGFKHSEQLTRQERKNG